MIVARQIFYQGHVQGVGFRYTVKRLATGYEVTGWVRNLPDGRVELQVRGAEKEVNEFLDAIAGGQLRPHIQQQLAGDAVALEENTMGFEIRH